MAIGLKIKQTNNELLSTQKELVLAEQHNLEIQKQLNEIEKFKNLERIKIPEGFDFFGIHGLSNELKEKLSNTKPTTLGQVSRIDGMTPSAIRKAGCTASARQDEATKAKGGLTLFSLGSHAAG